jgi:hypothetical protein
MVLTGVPQGFVLGPLVFNILINDLCNVINYSVYLLLADDTKVFHAIKFPNLCKVLQYDIDSVQGWCTANFMKLNISKTRVIYFSRKTKRCFTVMKYISCL